jgi:hypothetical protein
MVPTLDANFFDCRVRLADAASCEVKTVAARRRFRLGKPGGRSTKVALSN